MDKPALSGGRARAVAWQRSRLPRPGSFRPRPRPRLPDPRLFTFITITFEAHDAFLDVRNSLTITSHFQLSVVGVWDGKIELLLPDRIPAFVMHLYTERCWSACE